MWVAVAGAEGFWPKRLVNGGSVWWKTKEGTGVCRGNLEFDFEDVTFDTPVRHPKGDFG